MCACVCVHSSWFTSLKLTESYSNAAKYCLCLWTIMGGVKDSMLEACTITTVWWQYLHILQHSLCCIYSGSPVQQVQWVTVETGSVWRGQHYVMPTSKLGSLNESCWQSIARQSRFGIENPKVQYVALTQQPQPPHRNLRLLGVFGTKNTYNEGITAGTLPHHQ